MKKFLAKFLIIPPYVAALAIVAVLMSCGSSQRQDTLKAATTTVMAAEEAVIAYDRVHMTEIATNPTSTPEQKRAALASYRASRAKVEAVIDATWRALGIAGPLNDNVSMANVKLALAQMAASVGALLAGGAP